MFSTLPVCAFALFLFLFTAGAEGRRSPKQAEAGWRTDWTGKYPKAKPPLSWTLEENITWKTMMEQWSNATPVLHHGRIFVCEEPSTLVCIDRRGGEVLWRSPVKYEEFVSPDSSQAAAAKESIQKLNGKTNTLRREIRDLNTLLKSNRGDKELTRRMQALRQESNRLNVEMRKLRQSTRLHQKPVTHTVNGYSSPTPVAAGKRVFVLFGTGVAAAFDLEGKRQWARVVGRPTNAWGHSASPVLVDGKLIVHIDRTLHALDPESGETIWTAQSASFWGTPLPVRIGRSTAVLTTGGDLVRCSDGAIVARGIGRMPWTTPIIEGGVIYIVDQHGAGAYRLPERLDDSVDVEVLWQAAPRKDRYYASPVLHEGLLYAITQGAVFTVLDAGDGTIVYSKNIGLKGTVYPSICLAGGKLYVSSDQGRTLVIEPGSEYRELASNELEPFRSSPVFDGSQIYIRGLKHLYCIGAG
jgi:outer membrane protein assembly factor BamB